MNYKKIIREKLKNNRKYKVLYLRAIVHLIRYLLISKYRLNRCFIDPSSDFFYKYKYLANYFAIPMLIVARYLKKKKIFISVNNNCNYSVGHIYGEIQQLQRMQMFEKKYSGSIIWFTTTRKEILRDTKNIFENQNFRIFFGGLKRIFLTFVAIKDPTISIDGSMSIDNYIFGNKPLSRRFDHYNKPKKMAALYIANPEFHPYKNKLSDYFNETNKLIKSLKIIKKYVVIQIKTTEINGTIKILDPSLLLKSIEYLQEKDYQIVFAGREKLPNVFLNKSIVNYANSEYASSFNDYLLIGNCSLAITSASGFYLLPESFDKPLLIVNAHHIGQFFGRRTIYLPTLLSRKSKIFNVKTQFNYLCTYGPDCGYDIFNDFYILHQPTSDEIFMGVKELEEMLSDTIPSFTLLQKQIREGGICKLSSKGLSRISDFYLSNHRYFFEKKN